MNFTDRNKRIVQLGNSQDVEYWTRRLSVSFEELVDAVNVVGVAAVDVEKYLGAAQESMGSYVARMRSRLNQIESQLEALTDESKRIVGFLEGYAQLQRAKRPTLNALSMAMLAGVQPSKSSPNVLEVNPEYFSTEVLGTGHWTSEDWASERPLTLNQASPTQSSSAAVLEVVYRLLQDGRRRTLQEILSFLDIRSIPLKGGNPGALLSTILSRDSRFDANRREGWGLVDR